MVQLLESPCRHCVLWSWLPVWSSKSIAIYPLRRLVLRPANMRLYSFLYSTLLAVSGTEALRSDKVKLSNIQSLTLRKGLQTSARRVDPIPQVCDIIPPTHPSTFESSQLTNLS